ncbi:MAG TPA: hypothetical protein PK890_05280 [Terrimesophilobacter sp.]|nr:hypothetical protein [Terrimesophilobacter sp.]
MASASVVVARVGTAAPLERQTGLVTRVNVTASPAPDEQGEAEAHREPVNSADPDLCAHGRRRRVGLSVFHGRQNSIHGLTSQILMMRNGGSGARRSVSNLVGIVSAATVRTGGGVLPD